MKKQTLESISRALRETVGRVSCVNAGGCGVVAVQLFHSLVAKGESPKLVKITPGWAHIVVQVDDVFLDANGVYARGLNEMMENARCYYGEARVELEFVEKVEAALHDRDMWNNSFDRSRIGEVMRMVEEVVEKAYARAQA